MPIMNMISVSFVSALKEKVCKPQRYATWKFWALLVTGSKRPFLRPFL